MIWFMFIQIFGKPVFYKKIKVKTNLMAILADYMENKMENVVNIGEEKDGTIIFDVKFVDLIKVCVETFLILLFADVCQ